MYLCHTTVRKEGKVHRYWRLVCSVRVGRRVIQKTVAQLCELDARGRLQAQALAWHLIAALPVQGASGIALPHELLILRWWPN